MKKNLYLYVLIGVLSVFTIGYFVIVNTVSYAFVSDEESTTYNHKVVELKIASIQYAKEHMELFAEGETAYIIVDDLVQAGLIEADADGKVKDPSNSLKNMNNTKIRLTKTENGFEVKILS